MITGQYLSGCGGSSSGSCAACTGISAGYYFTGYGSSTATSCPIAACPVGTYGTVVGATSLSQCLQCPAGTYASAVGSTVCTSCPAGSYSATVAQTACASCAARTYASQSGATACQSCTLACAPGFWNGCGGASPDVCQWCANAVASQYYPGPSGGTTATCPVATAAAGMFRPFSNPYWPASLSIVDARFSPTPGSFALNIAGPFTYSSMSNLVPCYKNAAGTYLWYWASAWSLSTSFCGYTGMVLKPKTVATVQLQPSTTLPDVYFLAATPYTYTVACPSGTYSTAVGAVSIATCTACGAGTWSSGTGLTLASACSGCQTGTFSTALGATSVANCASCAAGSVALSTGLTTCSACAAGTYSSSASVACAQCSGGSYAAAASATVCTLCVAGTYGQALGASSALGACPYSCNAGYYGLSAGQNTFNLACSACPMGTWGTVTGASSKVAGCANTCPVGTYSIATGQTSQSGACGTCAVCFPGIYTVSACTSSAQAVCALVAAPYFLRISTNSAVSYTPATSDRLTGTVPYTLTFTSFAPGYTVPTATVNVGTTGYTPQYSTLPTPYSVRVLYECPALGAGRIFIPWSPPITTVSCTTAQACPPSPACDLKSSSACVGGTQTNGYVTGGYYTGPDGVTCLPCTTTASAPTCGWGMYGSIAGCSATSDSTCAPCRGALPANAQWVGPVAPFYFADSAASPCRWTCNMGFYVSADGLSCVACAALPSNALGYAPGDYLGSNPVSLYTGGPSKLVGGSLLGGCGVVCPPNTYLYTTKNSGGAVDLASFQCAPCPPVSCPLGQSAQYTAACPICQNCSAIDVNGYFFSAGSCSFQCNAGYYNVGGMCMPCTSRSCALIPGYYQQACTQTTDTACVACSQACAAGKYTASACTGTSDRQCLPCTNVVYGSGIVGPECVPQCNANYAYNSLISTCQACATSPTQCKVYETLASTCDSTFWGCVPCPAPATSQAWCWVATIPGQCTYDILPSSRCYYPVSQPPAAPTTSAAATTLAAVQSTTNLVRTTTAPGLVLLSTTTPPPLRTSSPPPPSSTGAIIIVPSTTTTTTLSSSQGSNASKATTNPNSTTATFAPFSTLGVTTLATTTSVVGLLSPSSFYASSSSARAQTSSTSTTRIATNTSIGATRARPESTATTMIAVVATTASAAATVTTNATNNTTNSTTTVATVALSTGAVVGIAVGTVATLTMAGYALYVNGGIALIESFF